MFEKRNQNFGIGKSPLLKSKKDIAKTWHSTIPLIIKAHCDITKRYQKLFHFKIYQTSDWKLIYKRKEKL